ncbi:hypothetical protein QBC46DRAFT_379351 [Diplogelasinospora grovesii]|uniref:Uncharacterized protein n=1 Tax=Diplogelasinospora grovesii TaxID=303347 RepID=A0AAN6S704_9PEZI|nr:hypothetical protein QBC46DRAFT_379351 [Diplogelasinospora grovesii]
MKVMITMFDLKQALPTVVLLLSGVGSHCHHHPVAYQGGEDRRRQKLPCANLTRCVCSRNVGHRTGSVRCLVFKAFIHLR